MSTDPRTAPDRSAGAARHALLLLGAGVGVGVVLFGAPNRFGAAQGAAPFVRRFLESLGPLALLHAAIGVAFAAVVWQVFPARGAAQDRSWRRMRLPLAALLALAVLQLVPLPGFLLRLVAPFSAETYEQVTVAGELGWRPLSLWPSGGLDALYLLLGVIAVSAATWHAVHAQGARGEQVVRRVLLFVVVFATLTCGYGLYSTHFGRDTVLGFVKASSRGRVTGTFIAAPTLGVWGAMGACAALATCADRLFDDGRRPRVSGAALILAGLLCAAVCAAATVLSLSRLMTMALGAGLLLLAFLLAGAAAAAGRRKLRALLLLACAALPLAPVAAMAFIPAFRERVLFFRTYVEDEAGPVESRFAGWEATWDLFLESPLLGTGLGSFGRAIHLTQSVDSPQELWYAHSDPLNLLSDGGIVGLVLGAAWLLAAGVPGLRHARRGPPSSRALAAGCVSAGAAVVFGALADFATQFPVVALPFAALLTAAAALEAPGSVAAPPAAGGGAAARWRAPAAAGIALALAAVPLWRAAGRLTDLRAGWPAGATSGERSLAEGKRRDAAGRGSAARLAEVEKAYELFDAAAASEPLLDEAHYRRALAALSLGHPRADVLAGLGRARWVSRGRADVNLGVGLLYLDLLGTETAPYGPPGDSALSALREAGALAPQAFGVAWKVALTKGLSLAELRRMTPDRGHAIVVLGRHLELSGEADQALRLYEDAIRARPEDVRVIRHLAQLYGRLGRSDDGRAFLDSLGLDWP